MPVALPELVFVLAIGLAHSGGRPPAAGPLSRSSPLVHCDSFTGDRIVFSGERTSPYWVTVGIDTSQHLAIVQMLQGLCPWSGELDDAVVVLHNPCHRFPGLFGSASSSLCSLCARAARLALSLPIRACVLSATFLNPNLSEPFSTDGCSFGAAALEVPSSKLAPVRLTTRVGIPTPSRCLQTLSFLSLAAPS